MTLSLYEVSIPALIRGLQNLSAQIDKAVEFVSEHGIDEVMITDPPPRVFMAGVTIVGRCHRPNLSP